MKAGDRIIVCTPGGGGWGKVGQEKVSQRKPDPTEVSGGRVRHAAREDTALQV